MVFEFDKSAKDDDEKNTAVCFYFTTQNIPGIPPQTSPRYCPDDKNKEKSEKGDFAEGRVTIPLWNVKRITTNILEPEQITDISFHMRYTNTSDPAGYYKWDETVIQNAKDDGSLDPNAVGVAIKDFLINRNDSAIYSTNDDGEYEWTRPTWGQYLNGDYIQKWWNISAINIDDIITVKTHQISANDVPKPGCSVDILAGSTLKGAKFF